MKKRLSSCIKLCTPAIVAVVTALTVSCSFSQPQPIKFSHKKHIDQGLECSTCHRYFNERAISGRPTVKICAECHGDGPITESAEEKKLIENYINKNMEIPWKRVYNVPGHVYYTHFRHVKFAKLKCSFCHGPVEKQDKPLTKPLKKITMYFCYDCHQTKGVSVDCITCHR